MLLPPSPPLQNRTANPGRSGFFGSERLKQIAFRADDADLSLRDLDALDECARMVAAITAAIDPDPLPRRRAFLVWRVVVPEFRTGRGQRQQNMREIPIREAD